MISYLCSLKMKLYAVLICFCITVSKQEEQEKAKSGSVVVQNTTNLSSSARSSPTNNGTGPNFDTGKIKGVESVFDRENGDDDPWDNCGWEFKVTEMEEPKNDITNEVQASFHKENSCIGRWHKL